MDFYTFLEVSSHLSVDDVVTLAQSNPVYTGYANTPNFWSSYIGLRYGWNLGGLSLYDARLIQRINSEVFAREHQ